jgi:NAD(P)H-hydrate epimerase
MAAKAATRSGVGLLTAFVPESLQPSFAAALPEAMWVPMPETPDGGLALEGRGVVVEKLSRATALVAGPGLGTERETQVLLLELLKEFDGPAVFDADALQPEVIAEAPKPERLALTPHAGEFSRLAGKSDACPRAYSGKIGCTTVLKGPFTRICSAECELFNVSGGPVLARGGSGDLLAGIIGSLAARGDRPLFDVAALGVLWHGRAADALARQHGQEAVNATELLDYLSFSLRNDF